MASCLLQTLDHLVDFLHAFNTLFVLLCTLLNLKVNLSNIDILGKLVSQLLSLCSNQLLLLDNVVSLCLSLNLVDSLLSMSLNELDHTLRDLLRL